MRVFVTGGTGHAGSHIIPELIAAGHEVTGLARSDTSAAAVSALGATVRRGSLEDLDGLKEAAADSDGVIHVAHRQDLLPSGGMDAVAAAELPIMLAYGEALAGTGKPLVAAGSIGSARAGPGPAGHRGGPGPSQRRRGQGHPAGSQRRRTHRSRPRRAGSAVIDRAASAHRAQHDRYCRLPPGADRAREGEGLRRLPRRRRERVERRAHPRCRLRCSAWRWRRVRLADIGTRVQDRGHPVPRDRRGHRQPSGLARRERSRGRPDAAGILRACSRIWSR